MAKAAHKKYSRVGDYVFRTEDLLGYRAQPSAVELYLASGHTLLLDAVASKTFLDWVATSKEWRIIDLAEAAQADTAHSS